MDYTYYSKNIQPSLTLGVMIEPRSIFAKITEGYHSYFSVNFVCDSIVPSIFGGYVYFTNEEGEIVSNKIRYTGKYIKL